MFTDHFILVDEQLIFRNTLRICHKIIAITLIQENLLIDKKGYGPSLSNLMLGNPMTRSKSLSGKLESFN